MSSDAGNPPPAGTRDINAGDDYLKKLNTLLPAEVTGLYLFVRSLANNDRNLDLYLAIFVLIIAVVFYLIAPQLLRITRPLTRLLYALTFVLWVCSIEITTIAFRLSWDPITFILTASVAIWTFALPFIFDSLKSPRQLPQQ
jgi:hypothetical protein